jgi:hypothetical protein
MGFRMIQSDVIPPWNIVRPACINPSSPKTARLDLGQYPPIAGRRRPLAPRPITTDKAAMIDSREKLEVWLEGHPVTYAQVIAARVALRVLPYAATNRFADQRIASSLLTLFRATIISWASRNFPAHEMRKGAYAAANASAVFSTASAADSGAYATSYAAVYAAADLGAYTATDVATYSAAYAKADTATFWNNLSADCDWLAKSSDPVTDARRLTHEPLWPRGAPEGWDATWQDGKARLLDLGPSYKVWTDWYDRRISGNNASFDIPGDTSRVEDKAILARLADATNEDFWGRGATYVNTTLQNWIDEARARVSALPEQDPAAITYGVNDRGQLDRLSAHDQQHLRDIPDQQQIYGDVREAALELQGEGQQRLGPKLDRALSKFIESMPEAFGNALAYPVWRDGNALRRIYRVHRLAVEKGELSSDQLEPVIAEGLGGLLDLYNHFAFGDDGLRAKDETTIPLQERASARDEAAAAAPIAAALLEAREVATDIVIDDINAEAEADTLPDGDPYADQLRDQTNRNWRNRVAAILTGLRNRAVSAGRKTVDAAYGGIIGMGLTDAATGTQTLTALGKFVAANAQAFITYVSTAFPTYKLAPLIEMFARMFGT